MDNYHLVRGAFLKALAVIYIIAFASIAWQITGLVGTNGILPVASYLSAVYERFGFLGYWLVPTIFWFNTTDTLLQMIPWFGVILAILLLLGLDHPVLLLLLYATYLSLVSAGQDFMAFQWDILLLEAGFLAMFIKSPSNLVIRLFRWLLFRLMFLSGAVKLLSGDPSWWNLTALDYHFETQPLPTIIGWYAHQLPSWLHQFSTLLMFGIELIVPFFFFGPRQLRLAAAGATVLLQSLIFLTGNYTFFNPLTMALSLFLLDDASLRQFTPQKIRPVLTRLHHLNFARTDREQNQEFLLSTSKRFKGTVSLWAIRIVAMLIIFITSFQLLGFFGGGIPQPIRTGLTWLTPLRLVNTYGLFAVMTTSRPEIIIEGSVDGETWQEYEFKYKPGDLYRSPDWVAPYQPRLDWQMWFAALGDYRSNGWFVNLMTCLQQGSPEVLRLLAKNPFPTVPPRYLRAWLYTYHFTDPATLATTGRWWRREKIGLYFPQPGF